LVDQALQAGMVVGAEPLQILIPELIDDNRDHKLRRAVGLRGRSLGEEAVTREEQNTEISAHISFDYPNHDSQSPARCSNIFDS
jgi:hypothetical protein